MTADVSYLQYERQTVLFVSILVKADILNTPGLNFHFYCRKVIYAKRQKCCLRNVCIDIGISSF